MPIVDKQVRGGAWGGVGRTALTVQSFMVVCGGIGTGGMNPVRRWYLR